MIFPSGETFVSIECYGDQPIKARMIVKEKAPEGIKRWMLRGQGLMVRETAKMNFFVLQLKTSILS